MFIEQLPSPVVFIGPSGEDSLLVYTYDNILYHYIINSTNPQITIVPVGQIAFNGIVRAPTRVRAISWVLPEEQMRESMLPFPVDGQDSHTSIGNGDPSQDVKVASVILLVDGNLVLLQPTVTESGDLKYDMRVISHDVEYYILMRDQLSFNFSPPVDDSLPANPSADMALAPSYSSLSLRDSLWMFRGQDLLAWNDVQDVLQQETVPAPLNIPLDFYPLSVLLNKGIVLGVESEMMQRRDVTFTSLKFAIRVRPSSFSSITKVSNQISDTSLPSILPPIQPDQPWNPRSSFSLSTLLPTLILRTRFRNPTPPRPRRRSREPKPRQQIRRPSPPRRSPPSHGHRLPPSIPPNTRVPRHCRTMYKKNRAPLLAHAFRLPAPTKGPLRTSPKTRCPQNSRRVPARPPSLRRRGPRT